MLLRIIRATHPNEPELNTPRQILAGVLDDPSSGRLGLLFERIPSKYPLSDELFPEAFKTDEHKNQGVKLTVHVLTLGYHLQKIFGRFRRADARRKKPRPREEVILLQNYMRFYDFCHKAPRGSLNEHFVTVQILTVDMEKEENLVASVPVLIDSDDTEDFEVVVS